MAFGKTAKDFFNDEIANQAIRDAFYLPETDAQAEEYLETCDTLGVSSDYFAYEFLCTTSPDIHSDDYLNIEEFNTIHGIYWEEQ